MKHRIARALAVASGLGLAVAPIAPAAAAETFGSGASTSTVFVQLLDQLTLELSETTSSLESLPSGGAVGVALRVADQTVGATSAESTGAEAQEPSEGSGCATPDLGIAGLDVGVLCSVSQAAGTPLPFGHATTAVGEIGVNGSLVPDLVDAIVATLADSLGVSVDDVVAMLTDPVGPVLEPIISSLEEACVALLEETDPAVDVITDTVDTIGSALPEDVQGALDPIAGSIEGLEVCEVLSALLQDLPEIGSIVDVLADALRDALSGLDLLHVGVGNAFSDSTTTTDSIVSEASLVGVSLRTLSLADVQHVLDAVVDGVVASLIAQLEAVGVTGDLLPSVDDLVALIDGLLPTGLVLSDDPILALTVTPTTATAVLDRATGEVSSAGQAPVATIDLSDTLGILLGENTTVEVDSDMDPVVVLEGTPLETRLAVGDVTTFEDVVDGMPVAGATARSVDLVIGAGLPGGGIQLVAGDASAQVTGVDVSSAQPDEQPNLPRTGGGLALVGLLALSGLLIRRR